MTHVELGKTKIAYIINSLRKNGPSNVLMNLLFELDRSKFVPVVITFIDENDVSVEKQLESIGIQLIKLTFPKSFKSFFRGRELVNVLNHGQYDVIHTHTHVPTILSQKFKGAKVTTVHNRLLEDFSYTYGKIVGQLITRMYIFAMRRYDKVICCSKSSWMVTKKYIPSASYILNGIHFEDRKESELKKQLNIPEDAYVYLYVGALTELKRVRQLVLSFKENLERNEYLIILGDGPQKETIASYASEQIRILGFKENVADYLDIADVYVSFSQSEGMPIAVLEALHKNLKVLLSDIPSHRELFEIDNSLYIGELFDDQNFKNKIEDLRKNKNIASVSREYQEKYLSARCMTTNYEKVYEELI